MNDLVMTGWSGTEFAVIAANTVPIIGRYSRKHGASFACVNLGMPSTPASWAKVPYMAAALRDFDRVLWIDADVVVVNSQESLFAEHDQRFVQAVVPHVTGCGFVPNCGVWLVTRQMIPILEGLWENRWPSISHPWWEQSAVMRLLGYSSDILDGDPVSADVGSTELREKTQFMSPKWNHHPKDANRVESPNFVHVTQYEDRIGEVVRLCQLALESQNS